MVNLRKIIVETAGVGSVPAASHPQTESSSDEAAVSCMAKPESE